MKKSIINLVLVYFAIILTLTVILSSCASKVHCDAYGQANYPQNNDSASK